MGRELSADGATNGLFRRSFKPNRSSCRRLVRGKGRQVARRVQRIVGQRFRSGTDELFSCVSGGRPIHSTTHTEPSPRNVWITVSD